MLLCFTIVLFRVQDPRSRQVAGFERHYLVNFMTLVPHAGHADFSSGLPFIVVPRWTFVSSTATFFLHLRQYISIMDVSPHLGDCVGNAYLPC